MSVNRRNNGRDPNRNSRASTFLPCKTAEGYTNLDDVVDACLNIRAFRISAEPGFASNSWPLRRSVTASPLLTEPAKPKYPILPDSIFLGSPSSSMGPAMSRKDHQRS
jgi:hypothetical protein